MSKKRRPKRFNVVTMGDLELGTSCDCGKPLKAVRRGSPKLKLGKLDVKGPPFGGFGKHCVVDEKDRVVRCFKKKATATKVARGFGPGFRVKTG